jgi:phenylacetate-CoA ligase
MHQDGSLVPLYPGLREYEGDRRAVTDELNRVRQRQADPEAIRRTAHARLDHVLRFAATTIPYYRRRVGGNPSPLPDEPLTASDLNAFPFLTKALLHENMQDLCDQRAGSLRRFKRMTSGTTGVPLTVIFDTNAMRYNWVVLARQLEQLGVSVSGELGSAWHLVIISDNSGTLPVTGHTPMPGGPRLTRLVFHSGMTRGEKTGVVRRLSELTPMVLHGTPTALLLLGSFLREGAGAAIPQPLLILCSGEQLQAEAREGLENLFGPRVYNLYATAEIGNVGCECMCRTGFHFDSDRLVIEVVRGDRPVAPGEDGEIVLTDLTNLAMPLIRYRTGDFGRLASRECDCGIAYPRLDGLLGRIIYYFTKRDGTLYNPIPMAKTLAACGFRQYQVIQASPDEIELRFIPGAARADLVRAASAIRDVAGEVGIRMTAVESFPEQTGKRSTFLSAVPNPYAQVPRDSPRSLRATS